MSVKNLERVSSLTPLFLGKTNFPFRIFLSSEKNTYYGNINSPIEDAPARTSYDDFPDIFKILTAFLDAHNVKTSFMKQAGFKSKNDIKNEWNALKRDEKQIKRNGVTVTETLSSRQYALQENNYILPWNTFEEFITFSEQDKTSFFVFDISSVEHSNRLVEYGCRNLKCQLVDNQIWVESLCENKEQQNEEWKKFTQYAAAVILNKSEYIVV